MSSFVSKRNPLIYLEPTNICNLKCALCPTNRNMERQRGTMPFSQYRLIINSIRDRLPLWHPFINLWGWGDPLQNDEIDKFCEYSIINNFSPRLSTNLYTKNIVLLEKIINSGVVLILIGLDGISENSYNYYRKKSNVNTIKKNIEFLVRKKEQNDSSTYIVINSLITKRSLPEMNDIINWSREIGTDALMFKYINLWRDKKTGDEIGQYYTDYIPDNFEFARYKSNPSKKTIHGLQKNCPFYDKCGMILWNGDITGCFFDINGKYKIGNVYKKNYLDILGSERSNELWKEMMSKKLSICSTCDSGGKRKLIHIFNNSLKNNNVLNHL